MEKETQNISKRLPQEQSSVELREAVIKNLEAALDLIPKLPIHELNVENLEKVEPGTYILNEPPPVDFIKEIPKFMNGESEIGLFCAQGRWIIQINKYLLSKTPSTLKCFEKDRVFQIDMHSHPGTDPGAEQPSEEDIEYLNSTIDGYNYIISENGILEFHIPNDFSEKNITISYCKKIWKDWILEGLKLTEEEFNNIDAWKLKKQFFEKFFGLKVIPWEKISEIKKILDKDQLRIDRYNQILLS
jgi:hypothetical protein